MAGELARRLRRARKGLPESSLDKLYCRPTQSCTLTLMYSRYSAGHEAMTHPCPPRPRYLQPGCLCCWRGASFHGVRTTGPKCLFSATGLLCPSLCPHHLIRSRLSGLWLELKHAQRRPLISRSQAQYSPISHDGGRGMEGGQMGRRMGPFCSPPGGAACSAGARQPVVPTAVFGLKVGRALRAQPDQCGAHADQRDGCRSGTRTGVRVVTQSGRPSLPLHGRQGPMVVWQSH